MYRFLDRPVAGLDPVDRLLIWAMRSWVAAIGAGRCPCSTLGPAFAGWRLQGLLPDFNTAMMVLNNDGQGPLHFGPVACGRVGDDEAVLLALFAGGLAGTDGQLRRIATQLAQPSAVSTLVTAVDRIAATLAHAPAVWDIPDAAKG